MVSSLQHEASNNPLVFRQGPEHFQGGSPKDNNKLFTRAGQGSGAQGQQNLVAHQVLTAQLAHQNTQMINKDSFKDQQSKGATLIK